MKLKNSFRIDRPVPEVYDAFLDVERIATCMPGSRLLGEPQPGTYEGEVKVKVGPLGVSYTGQFMVLEADEDSRVLTMRAKGREQGGAGNADAHIVATMTQDGGGTNVAIDTDLSIRGKVAQFGRGIIGDVTDEIMQTFAGNVEQMLASGGAPETSPAESPGSAAPAEPTGPAVAGSVGSELNAWSLVVRPMLQRHAAQIAQIALTGLAAYVGARAGARAAGDGRHVPRRRPHLHYY